MKIVSRAEIQAALDLDYAFEAIRHGFIALADNRVQLGPVGHLAFPAARGDCHIKSAAIEGGDVFAVKIAAGFAANAERGLPTSNGMMMLFSALTGEPLALLQDEGWLTDLRTGIAGAIAARAIASPGASTIGIVGTGIQARLQAELAAGHCSASRIAVWGRRAEQAARLAAELAREGFPATAVASLEALAEQADVVITTTPATTPMLTHDMFPGVARIVAVGADAPGKQELTSELTASMDIWIADAIAQCLDHGELARPYADRLIPAVRVQELGRHLAAPETFRPTDRILVDLTGVGIQDLQIASAVWSGLDAHQVDRAHAADRP